MILLPFLPFSFSENSFHWHSYLDASLFVYFSSPLANGSAIPLPPLRYSLGGVLFIIYAEKYVGMALYTVQTDESCP